MEYLEGETLAACLERTVTLSWQTACAIAQRIASAVGAAHAHGVVHRDLKPGNVFVSRVVSSDVTERRIKVLDFGLAKLLSDDRNPEPITRAGMLLGTPMYIAPEQCNSAEQVTPAADIYALGCILFEMICGRPPFERDGLRAILAAHMFEAPPRPSERVPAVPRWLDDLIARMLAKKPADRPGSMAEVAESLATAGHEDAGLTWLMPGSATAMLPATVLPTPVPSRIQWPPDWRLPRWRFSQLRLPQLRLPPLRLPQWRLPYMSRVARNLRLSVIDRRVRRVAGAAVGLVVLVVISAIAFSHGGHPPPRASAASLTTATTRVVAAAPAKAADSGPATAVTAVPASEPVAPPPTAAVEVPEAPVPLQVTPAEIPAPVRRRIREAPVRRRPEPLRVHTPTGPDGIVDL
jgi:serine/threonine-protein kinase